MDLVGVSGKVVTDLAKNEGIQNGASSVLGMLFPYVGIRKRALDTYISDVEKSDMSSEAKLIAILNAKDTIKRLKNKKGIADIAIENAEEGTDFSATSGVNQEWLERFMDSAGVVSEEDVQLMWGKILASEFENPGSTPHNMIRILSEITPQYAKAFQMICSMQRCLFVIDEFGKVVISARHIVVPYGGNEETMGKLGLSFAVLNELETLGLIKLNTLTGYAKTGIPKNHAVCIYVNGKTKELKGRDHESVPSGNVLLTDAGLCLSKITESIQVADYELLDKKYMESFQMSYKEESKFKFVDNGKGGLRLEIRKGQYAGNSVDATPSRLGD